MKDLEIINVIEIKLGITLQLNVQKDLHESGYWLNQDSQVIGLNINACKSLSLGLIKKELEALYQLSELSLANNQLKEISLLASFGNLKVLGLRQNEISNIGPLSKLTHLEQLDLFHNKIEDISAIENFINLYYLNISYNEVVDIKPLKGLTQLTHLNLYHNKIYDISPLENLKNLVFLFLKNNAIEVLPAWIVKFNMGIRYDDYKYDEGYIYLYGNPIKFPPIEIVKRGEADIARYFEQILLEGTDFIYETKLILVGEGNSGKTSLQVRLIDEKAILPKQDGRTRGIKIYDWIFKHEKSGVINKLLGSNLKDKKHIAHIWDFGGQDVYYPVHRFFLTENSVFVLLGSTRNTHHNFDYWIPTIYQFGGSSPIILGQTCHDGNKVPWNDLGYYFGNSIFNIIKTRELPYYELNLPKNNEGLAHIKNIIIEQLISLPHYGKGVPKSWVTIRDKITEVSKKNAIISYVEFKFLCKKINPIAFIENSSVDDCAKFMHSIGIILWYADNDTLKDYIILQPEWAMNAVYKIIDDDVVQQQHGVITKTDFQRLWKEDNYKDNHPILKQMLEVFKIAFPKKYPKGDYILPARLASMPNTERWSENNQYIKLEYKYDFMPRGIVNQLSAVLSRYISDDKQVWNNAVNMADEIKTSRCQVEEDFYFRKIFIRAMGQDGRGLVILAMNALQDITDGYKGVKPEIYVPCTCTKCQVNKKPSQFLYNDLLRWSNEEENAKVYCNEGRTFLTIDMLLRNVGLKETIAFKDKNKSSTVEIFLASSTELINDRENFEIFINRENKRLNTQGVFLQLHLWEDFIDAMSQTRLQDEYNKVVRSCNIYVSIFFTKVGKFNSEEFKQAFGQFKKSGKPYIYTYFKNTPVNSNEIKKADFDSKNEFLEELKSLGHFPTIYENIDQLQNHFRGQLDKLIAEGLI